MALEQDPSCLDADKLQWTTGEDVQKLMGWSREVPLQEERARLLREVGAVVCRGGVGVRDVGATELIPRPSARIFKPDCSAANMEPTFM